MSNVSVGFSAQPNQVLDAYRKIEEAAKRANKELRSMKDVDFPGLDEARQQLERINAGLAQMGSKLVRGSTAEAYRAGVRGGAYQGGDIVSALRGMRSQYPDEVAYQREVKKLLAQAGNLANMGGVPGGGGGSGAAGGGGWGGLLPMARSVLPWLGLGSGLAFAGKKLGGATDEAIGMSDLRRQVGGLDMDFEKFRDTIRKSSDALGVGVEETIRLNKEYASLSGAMGGNATASGTNAGIRLARMFGLDAGVGVGMMGRAGWLGLAGGDQQKQARMLAEAMAGSNLGGRQAEAAEAMLRFAEKSSGILGNAGNIGGMMGFMRALFNSPDAGIKANAAGILSGYDDAVRSGGRAGDAGKNFIYRMMAMNGVTDPADVEMALEGGFAGQLPSGKMIGPELLRRIRAQYGYKGKNWMAMATKGLFGGSGNVALKVQDLLERSPGMDDGTMKARVDAIMKDLNAGDPGTKARIEANELEKELTKAMQGLVPVLNELKEQIVSLARGVNHIASFLPGWDKIKASASEAAANLPGPAGILGKARNAYSVVRESLGLMGTSSMFGDADFMSKMEAESNRLGIDPAVAKALMWHESRGRANAVSPTGAVGLFQLTKGTAKDMGLNDLQRYNPTLNMKAGLKYLAQLKERYGGNMEMALAAYNNGPTRIDRGEYQVTLPNGRTQDAAEFAKSIMVQVEVIHKDEKGRELKREKKDGGRIAVPTMAGAR